MTLLSTAAPSITRSWTVYVLSLYFTFFVLTCLSGLMRTSGITIGLCLLQKIFQTK